MLCTKCGVNNDEGAKFCKKCGSKLEVVTHDAIRAPINNSSNNQFHANNANYTLPNSNKQYKSLETAPELTVEKNKEIAKSSGISFGDKKTYGEVGSSGKLIISGIPAPKEKDPPFKKGDTEHKPTDATQTPGDTTKDPYHEKEEPVIDKKLYEDSVRGYKNYRVINISGDPCEAGYKKKTNSDIETPKTSNDDICYEATKSTMKSSQIITSAILFAISLVLFIIGYFSEIFNRLSDISGNWLYCLIVIGIALLGITTGVGIIVNITSASDASKKTTLGISLIQIANTVALAGSSLYLVTNLFMLIFGIFSKDSPNYITMFIEIVILAFNIVYCALTIMSCNSAKAAIRKKSINENHIGLLFVFNIILSIVSILASAIIFIAFYMSTMKLSILFICLSMVIFGVSAILSSLAMLIYKNKLKENSIA